MKKKSSIVAALLVALFLASCAVVVRMGVWDEYERQAAANPEMTCTPSMFGEAWHRLKSDHLTKMTDAQLMRGAMGGLERAAEKSVEMTDRALYNPSANAFLDILRVISFEASTYEALCYSSIRGMLKAAQDRYSYLVEARLGRQWLEDSLGGKWIAGKTERSIPSCSMKHGVPYCWIPAFGAGMADMLADRMRSTFGVWPGAIIIDLRSNGGGFIESAAAVASRFWLGRKTSAYLVGRKVTRATNGGVIAVSGKYRRPLLRSSRTVVLVDGNTMSAAEMLAAALRAYGMATLVGRTTGGKGEIQTPEFIEGAVMVHTTMRFLDPLYNEVGGTGVRPHVRSVLRLGDLQFYGHDSQLAEAAKILSDGHQDNLERQGA